MFTVTLAILAAFIFMQKKNVKHAEKFFFPLYFFCNGTEMARDLMLKYRVFPSRTHQDYSVQGETKISLGYLQ